MDISFNPKTKFSVQFKIRLNKKSTFPRVWMFAFLQKRKDYLKALCHKCWRKKINIGWIIKSALSYQNGQRHSKKEQGLNDLNEDYEDKHR